MDPKSVVLWILAAIGALATLIDNIKRIRTGIPIFRKYRLPITAALLLVTGASAGALWERREANAARAYLVGCQRDMASLEWKYESLREAFLCRPGTPQVLLFEDDGYQERRLCFTPGAYSNLLEYGFNDVVSSIRLVGNVKAVAYEDIDFGGRSLPIDQDYTSLTTVTPNWNDRISSLKVCRKQDQCD